MINDEEKQQIVKFKKLEQFCFKYHVSLIVKIVGN